MERTEDISAVLSVLSALTADPPNRARAALSKREAEALRKRISWVIADFIVERDALLRATVLAGAGSGGLAEN